MPLTITIQRIFIMPDQTKPLKAFADIIVNGALVIKGVKVVSGKNGLFASMPQEQNTQNKKWYPTVRCLDTVTKESMETTVLDAFSKASQN
jgi:DNA-binding cell septation regulator SpoVG